MCGVCRWTSRPVEVSVGNRCFWWCRWWRGFGWLLLPRCLRLPSSLLASWLLVPCPTASIAFRGRHPAPRPTSPRRVVRQLAAPVSSCPTSSYQPTGYSPILTVRCRTRGYAPPVLWAPTNTAQHRIWTPRHVIDFHVPHFGASGAGNRRGILKNV